MQQDTIQARTLKYVPLNISQKSLSLSPVILDQLFPVNVQTKWLGLIRNLVCAQRPQELQHRLYGHQQAGQTTKVDDFKIIMVFLEPPLNDYSSL